MFCVIVYYNYGAECTKTLHKGEWAVREISEELNKIKVYLKTTYLLCRSSILVYNPHNDFVNTFWLDY